MDRWNRTRALSLLVYLGLMTLADSVTDSLLLTFTKDSRIQPGSWNLRTYDIVLGAVSDVIGQSVLGYVLNTRSKYCAMIIHTMSILAAAIVTLSNVVLGHNMSLMAVTGGRLVKCVGGGCHGSVFLMLAMLHNQKPQHYFAYHYMTGAIGVLAQPLGTFSASRLSRGSHILSGVLSGLWCIMVYSVIIFLKNTDADTEESSEDESRPLLARQQQTSRVDDAPASQMAVPGYVSRPGRSNSPLRNQDLRFLPIVFGLMGFCKSTRPLFTTYIQHRHGVSPTEAEHLWLVRTVLSAALFVFTGLYAACIKESDSFSHGQARIAIIFISAGALAIGLPGSYNTITIALIINTIGVVTDLSILASASTLLGRRDAGPVLMLIASIESSGTLAGIGALYPLYQLSLRDSLTFLAGGIPYYICGTLYAVAAAILWLSGPEPATE